MHKIRAILFDFDGTLVDSEIMHFNSWNDVLKPFHLQLEEDDYFKNFAGIPSRENANVILNRHQLNTPPENLIKQKESYTIARLSTADIAFMPFAQNWLTMLHEKKFPMALVTGSSRAEINPILKRTPLSSYFKHIITRDDVTISKPNPEGYLKCAQLMGLQPEDYLVFEDTWAGVSAAKAAQLRCYAIQRNKVLHPKLQHADKVFFNLEEAYQYLLANKMLAD